MRKLVLAVLTVLVMCLTSCSMPQQPQQSEQQTETQVKFVGMHNVYDNPIMMELQDAQGNTIAQGFGIISENDLEGEYELFYMIYYPYNGQYEASQTFIFEKDQRYVFVFENTPNVGWQFVRQ